MKTIIILLGLPAFFIEWLVFHKKEISFFNFIKLIFIGLSDQQALEEECKKYTHNRG